MKLVKLSNYREAIRAVAGPIIGDMIGSPYEYPPEKRIRHTNFPLFSEESKFTDDSVLHVATMAAFLQHGRYAQAADFEAYYRDFYKRYPDRGYGERFRDWNENAGPSDSFANGAAMRVGPAAYVGHTTMEVLNLAEEISLPTHNEVMAITAAKSVALMIYKAKIGEGKREMGKGFEMIYSESKTFLSCRLAPEDYDVFYDGCPVSKAFPSVPQSIACFFHTDNAESAARRAVACAKDADTQASIALGIACPFYQAIPKECAENLPALPEEFIDIIINFSRLYHVPNLKLI